MNMNPPQTVSDDDLVLLYYGESEDASLASRVAADAELSRRYERLCADLSAADQWSPPERDESYGAVVWQRIAPSLAPRDNPPSVLAEWWQGLKRPRFSLAGALGLALVALLAYQAGRQESVPLVQPPELASGMGLDANRLLTHSVGRHLEQLDQALTNFVHLDQTTAADAGAATDLLVANRLYRQAASARGDRQLAAFLADLEPLLIELAYEAHATSPLTRTRMQDEVRNGLLFRVRALNQQMNTQQAAL